jgi:hypothetical protein
LSRVTNGNDEATAVKIVDALLPEVGTRKVPCSVFWFLKILFLVPAEITPIDHRCVAFRSSVNLRPGFPVKTSIEGE